METPKLKIGDWVRVIKKDHTSWTWDDDSEYIDKVGCIFDTSKPLDPENHPKWCSAALAGEYHVKFNSDNFNWFYVWQVEHVTDDKEIFMAKLSF